MCDPVSLAVASTAATVVGTGGSLMSSMSAQKAAKQQANEVNSWQRQQKQNRDASFVRQEELRKEADAARLAGLEQLGGESQNKRQEEAAAELTKQLTGEGQVGQDETGAPVSMSDADLAAQHTSSTTGDTYKSDLAAAINDASKGARHRMAALAKVSSYGTLGGQNKEILNRSGADIDKFNEFRRGELGVLGAQQAVDPVQVSYTPSPLADAFSTALQVGSQGLGNAFGRGNPFASTTAYSGNTPEMAGNLFPAVPKTNFIGPPKALPTYLQNTKGLF